MIGETEKTKVLVIDDEESVRDAVVAGLDAIGRFDVITTADGLTGLRMMEETHPDILLIDLVMSGMDGLEVLMRLKALESTARPRRIILMTAHADPLPDDVMPDLGLDGVLEKPFRLTDLEEAIG